MKRIQYTTLCSAIAVLAAVPVAAQKNSQNEPAKLPPHEQMQQHGKEFPLPTFVKAPLGTDATVQNGEGQVLGSIHDHVIDRKTGKVLFVAVATARGDEAKTYRVPFQRFEWNAEDGTLVLPIAEEQLAALPEYVETPPMKGGAKAEAMDAGSREKGKAHGMAMPQRGELTVTATHLVGSRIQATDDSKDALGTVDGLVLEPNRGTIAFVLASSSGSMASPCPIPWQAMTWADAPEGDESGHFTLERAAERIADAPKLEDGDLALLRRPEQLKRIFSFYGMKVPFTAEGHAGGKSAETKDRMKQGG